jgi:preprotein translocase subunit SecB
MDMEFDQNEQDIENEQSLTREGEQRIQKPVYFLPYDVQLQNTFCTEIIAKRNPEGKGLLPRIQVNIEEAQVSIQDLKAQVILHVQTAPANADDGQTPFEISFKILGKFTYKVNYSEDDVNLFLEQGSLSILLPFARELLLSICTRLQAPPMMLTMVQLAPHPSLHKNE